MKVNYNHTVYACYVGYITQALINNFVPLLFLTFKNTYAIPLSQIALLITANFGLQLIVDFFAAKFADRIGYRKMIVAAHIFAAAGLVLLGVLPDLLPNPMVGIVISVMCYAVGGGLIEVLVSPIVENCPSERKDAAMSLLHSFYCWGQMGVILLSTLFFVVFGYQNWAILAMLWAIVPFANAFFFAKVPIVEPKEQEQETYGMGKLFSMKIFWLFVVLMLCAGASELCMSQWASAFAEDGLKVSKWLGDLAGPCLFAVFMGLARVLHAKMADKIPLKPFMIFCGLLCIASYLLASLVPNPVVGFIGCMLCGFSVGIMWPGTFSLAAEIVPMGGTAMFGLLALAGDLGCSAGPTIAGIVASVVNDNLKIGLLCAIVFPALLIGGLLVLGKKKEV